MIDPKAFNEFVPLAKSMARKWRHYNWRLDEHDLYGAALDGIAEALQSHDEAKGLSLKSFVAYRIKLGLLNVVRRTEGESHLPGHGRRDGKSVRASSLAGEHWDCAEFFSRDGDRLGKVTPAEWVEWFCESLGEPDWAEMLRLRLVGMNLREIATRFEISESRVSQIFHAIAARICSACERPQRAKEVLKVLSQRGGHR